MVLVKEEWCNYCNRMHPRYLNVCIDLDNTIYRYYGTCSYEFKDDYCHIYNLNINPEFRGRGHAKNILNYTISKIRNTGWNKEIAIVCNPTEDNIDKERLSKFYKSLGLTVYECYM